MGHFFRLCVFLCCVDNCHQDDHFSESLSCIVLRTMMLHCFFSLLFSKIYDDTVSLILILVVILMVLLL